jgi:hypothetical protein
MILAVWAGMGGFVVWLSALISKSDTAFMAIIALFMGYWLTKSVVRTWIAIMGVEETKEKWLLKLGGQDECPNCRKQMK